MSRPRMGRNDFDLTIAYKRWIAKNYDRYEQSRDKRLAEMRNRQYGKDAAEHFEAQLKAQKNCCAICHEPFTITPRQDHDHKCCDKRYRCCNKCMRGLLCNVCNTRLATFEKLEWREAATAYLKYWEQINGK